MRIIELPFELCPNGKTALSVLTARNHELEVGFSVWLRDVYGFDGEEPPESYRVLATANRFAHFGNVTEDYPADTDTIDLEVGMLVMLQAPDNILDELTSNDGLSNELLVFAGDEILAVVGMELADGGAYRLKVVRHRYGTGRAAHAPGSEVYIIARSALPILAHDSFAPGYEGSLKLSTESNSNATELEDADAVEFAIVGSAFDAPPLNLRINGVGVNPEFVAATDIRFDWSLPDLRKSFEEQTGWKVRTFFEILKMDETVLWKKLTSQQFMKMTGVKLAAILGAETQFILRLSTDVLGPDFRLVSQPQLLTATQI